MKSYRILNLPSNPLNEQNFWLEESQPHFDKYFYIKKPSILKSSILKEFVNIGLDPYFVVIFNWEDTGPFEDKVIHSDINYNELTKTWENVSFGVNWDVRGAGKFHWFDIPIDVKKIFPAEGTFSNNRVLKLLNGIHYGHRSKSGIDKGYILTDTAETSQPMLVRTDIPHFVTYDSPRTCISLRFRNSININWEEIYYQFDSISLN